MAGDACDKRPQSSLVLLYSMCGYDGCIFVDLYFQNIYKARINVEAQEKRRNYIIYNI